MARHDCKQRLLIVTAAMRSSYRQSRPCLTQFARRVMPRISGFDVLDIIRSTPETAHQSHHDDSPQLDGAAPEKRRR
jgi:hypothetical protein